MTRPEIPIDWQVVEELLTAGCNGTEVASHFGMHQDTFYRRVQQEFNIGFTEYAANKRANGEALLKKVQFEKACGLSKKGDNTMLIWLGKQRLGQKENIGDVIIPEEVMKAFGQLMGQIEKVQEARKIADNSIINDPKSACVTDESNISTGRLSIF
jgi:AraC-like DNA-binding protein